MTVEYLQHYISFENKFLLLKVNGTPRQFVKMGGLTTLGFLKNEPQAGLWYYDGHLVSDTFSAELDKIWENRPK